ncbi:hypothetical protein [Labrenzia sp. R5_0]|uniref:hypothetical protein n=1 Tax=Labrenzia sp. R5_0 TaxID=2821108 RepID=UPI001ADA0D3A|nr:hypothetical protein [Labrenzia sp. R5_0]MBO9457958.1 hypothetical protein [Labrenzia sp. R5_0]
MVATPKETYKGSPASDTYQPRPNDIIALLTFIQAMAGAGGIAVNSAAALDAIAPTQDGAGAIIYGSGDPAVDGIYSWDLSSTDWIRIGPLPITFAELENVAGTANAITADVVGHASPGELKWIVWTPLYTNTAGGGEVLDLGNGDEPITSGSGGDLAPGDLVSGVTTMAFKDSAGNWRQLVSSRSGAIFDHKGDYEAGTTYTEGQAVTGSDEAWYQLKVASATGDDPVSGGSGDWLKILEPPVATVADGSLTTAKYADESVTFAKLGSDVGVHLTVSSVAAVKAIAVASVSPGDLVYWRGFDNATDNCGGMGIVVGSVASTTLDGVVMNLAAGSYHVRRVDLGEGPIHTRWCGIKPNVSSSATFNPDSFAANNSSRWETLNDFCETQLYAWISGSTAAYVVTNGIYVDPGIHDFADAASHTLSPGVTVDGAGMLISILRTNYSSANDFIVCDGSLSASYGAGNVIQNIGIRHFSTITTTTKYGLRFDSIVRGLHLVNVAIYGFGINLRTVDCWDIELTNVWLESAYYINYSTYGNINSFSARGCRFDGTRYASSYANVSINDNNHAARLVKFDDCAIQRSETVGIKFEGVFNLEVSSCQFEGNNRQDTSSPDIWVEATGTYSTASKVSVDINNNYFTTTGRNGATTSRAINIRNDVGIGSVLRVHGNCVADNTFGTFIDIDGNYAYQLFWQNRNIIGSNSNSIPANVNQY